jgi:hypothetical protein
MGSRKNSSIDQKTLLAVTNVAVRPFSILGGEESISQGSAVDTNLFR